MKKSFLLGILVGLILMSIIIWKIFPPLMLQVDDSKFDFNMTTEKLENGILDNGWEIQRIYDMEDCMKNFGYTGYSNIVIYSICKPKNVSEILNNDEDKKVTAMMPCRIGVYQTSEGTVRISRINIGLMGKIFGGNIAKVMNKVAIDDKKIVKGIIKE